MKNFILILKHKWHRLLEGYCWLYGHRWHCYTTQQGIVRFDVGIQCTRCKLNVQVDVTDTIQGLVRLYHVP